MAVVVLLVPREMNHDGTQSLTQSCARSMMVRGQRRLDWMRRWIVVVPGGRNVVPTICYGTGGERMDGDQRWEEEEEEAGAVM